MVASAHIKDPNREQRDFTSRVIALFLLALLAIFVLIARMIHLQVADYEKYRTRSDQNRIQVQPIGPPRGLIFDRNGVLLADNQPVFTLASDCRTDHRSERLAGGTAQARRIRRSRRRRVQETLRTTAPAVRTGAAESGAVGGRDRGARGEPLPACPASSWTRSSCVITRSAR